MYQVIPFRPRRVTHQPFDLVRGYQVRSREVYQIQPSNLQAYALQPGVSKSGESRSRTKDDYMGSALCRLLCAMAARHAIGDSPEWIDAVLMTLQAERDLLYATDNLTMVDRWRAECRTDGAEDVVQFEAMEATRRMRTGHARPDDRQTVVTYIRKKQAQVRASLDVLVGLARLLRSPREAR